MTERSVAVAPVSAAWAEKGYPLVNEYLGEIKVTRYDKRLKEEFAVREGH